MIRTRTRTISIPSLILIFLSLLSLVTSFKIQSYITKDDKIDDDIDSTEDSINVLSNDTLRLGYQDPSIHGGLMSAFLSGHKGLYEPINVIISGLSGGKLSDPNYNTRGGITSYLSAIGYDRECFNLHAGKFLSADLGDGQSTQIQKFIYRQQFSKGRWHDFYGACIESFIGGNHLRGFQQSTTHAWFLALSKEKNAGRNHNIVGDGYNIGRDLFVDAALRGGWLHGCRYGPASIHWVEGYQRWGWNHGIKTDGRVALITVPAPVGPFCT